MHMPHPMEMNARPLGIPETRMGSGTSWLPDASPMHAAHYMLGRWTLMLHGKGFLQYDWQSGSRGSNQLGIVNWALAAASRPLGGGQLDRKSTRLNSSHVRISYAVFCLKKKKKNRNELKHFTNRSTTTQENKS